MKKPQRKKIASVDAASTVRSERDELKDLILRMQTQIRHLNRELGLVYSDLDHPIIQPRGIYPVHKMTFAEAVVAVAENEWAAVIRDDDEGALRIDQYIRSPEGLGWGSAQVRHLDQRVPYLPGSFSWCGAFVAFCYGMATELRPRIRKYTLPSCSRLWRDWGGTARLRGTSEHAMHPEGGDIITIHNAHAVHTTQGQHIVLCTSLDIEAGTFGTIEGNGWGYLGDGVRGEGVVKNNRPLESIARIYRPLEADFS